MNNLNTTPQAPIVDAEESVLPIQQYWHVILKRVWTILLTSLAIFALVAVYTFKQKKVYEAETSLIINLSTPQVLGREVQPVVDVSQADLWNTEQYFETQYRIIKSRKSAEKVVERLGLVDDPVFLGIDHLTSEEKISEALEKIDPVDKLLSITEVEPAIKTRIVTVKVRHTDQELAAKLANTIAEVYLTQNIEQRRESTYGAYEWLTEQYREVKTRLEKSDQALYDFKRSNNILSTSLTDRQNITSQRLQDLNRQLTDVQTERIRLASEVDQLRRYRDGKRTSAPVEKVINNPTIQNLKTTFTDLRRREAELKGRYMEKHPEVVSIQKQVALVERELQREISNILSAAENNLSALQRSEQVIEGKLLSVKDDALQLNEKELTYRQLERENQTNQRLYELVLKRLKETDISRLLQENNVRILDRALVPTVPVAPKVIVNLLIGVVLGLIAGIVLAFVLELLDNTVKSREDIEDLLGLPFLGIIPTIKEAVRGPDKGQALAMGPQRDLHVFEFPKSTVAECCRTIRTNILFMSPDRRLRRMLVTSAGPQEGKTVTTVNIATVMAQSNTRVLLVDTDMRRPRVHKIFDFVNDVGLTNLILGEVDYDTAISRTPVPNLDLLKCGPIPPNPAELLHTERFQSIIRDLEDRYDLVLFDSPPTIAVTDSMILSQMVDGVLMVVKGGQTSKAFVRQARELLVGVNAPILGCILNDVNLDNRQYGYHTYYRHYGQYYTEDSELQEAEA